MTKEEMSPRLLKQQARNQKEQQARKARTAEKRKRKTDRRKGFPYCPRVFEKNMKEKKDANKGNMDILYPVVFPKFVCFLSDERWKLLKERNFYGRFKSGQPDR